MPKRIIHQIWIPLCLICLDIHKMYLVPEKVNIYSEWIGQEFKSFLHSFKELKSSVVSSYLGDGRGMVELVSYINRRKYTVLQSRQYGVT